MKNLRLALSLITVVAITLSGNLAKAQTAPSTIKVGTSASISGVMASGGVDTLDGEQIGVEHVNRAGGVYVKEFNKKIPMELIAVDDGSDATKTVSNLEALYAREKVIAYLSGFSSVLGAAGAAVGAKNKVPYLGTSIGIRQPHEVGNKYLFVPYNKTDDQGRGHFDMIEYLIKREKDPTIGNIAIYTQQIDFGIEQTKVWRKEAQKRGLKIVYEGKYGPTDRDFSTLLMEARAAGAQTLLDTGNPAVTIARLRQMKELNISFKWFYTVLGAATERRWVSSLGPDGDYVAWGRAWNHVLKFPMVKELNETYLAKKSYLPDGQVGAGYCLVQILADAIEKAGTLDREKIRDAIASNKFTTVMGPIKFNPDGTASGLIYFCDQYQNQKDELVWPLDLASKLPAITPPWSKRK